MSKDRIWLRITTSRRRLCCTGQVPPGSSDHVTSVHFVHSNGRLGRRLHRHKAVEFSLSAAASRSGVTHLSMVPLSRIALFQSFRVDFPAR